MELKNKVHVVENIFSKYTIFLGLYKAKGNMPVSNNLHPLSYYSREAKKILKSIINETWYTGKDRKQFTKQSEGLVLETTKLYFLRDKR